MTTEHRFASRFGTVRLTTNASGTGISSLVLTEDLPDEAPPETAILALARTQLEEYFAGTRRSFDLPLAPEGTELQKQVWTFLRTIPYGETRSYGQVARAIGRPTAARAVGAANGRNPLWIVIPCHRVIGADGSLTGYAGGIETKRGLLTLEVGA